VNFYSVIRLCTAHSTGRYPSLVFRASYAINRYFAIREEAHESLDALFVTST
jgi:hypothetical protein